MSGRTRGRTADIPKNQAFSFWHDHRKDAEKRAWVICQTHNPMQLVVERPAANQTGPSSVTLEVHLALFCARDT